MKRGMKLVLMLLLMGVVVLFASGCVSEQPTEEGAEDEATEEAEDMGVEDEVMEEDMEVEDEDMEVEDEEMEVEDEEMEDEDEEMEDEGMGFEEGEEYSPVINPEDFVEEIDNTYFPLIPGTTFVYDGEGEDGEAIRNEVSVTQDTREVMGVTTTVVLDKEWEDDELIEETLDWYAQDKDGNIWYFGEDSKEYEDGEVVSTAGSWEAGVGGAQPGILIKGDPQVGDVYRQEYLEGEAEDTAEVISLNESVTLAYGSFENCLKTKEWNPLEPDSEENKYYAPDLGLILEVQIKGGNERLELVEIITE